MANTCDLKRQMHETVWLPDMNRSGEIVDRYMKDDKAFYAVRLTFGSGTVYGITDEELDGTATTHYAHIKGARQ